MLGLNSIVMVKICSKFDVRLFKAKNRVFEFNCYRRTSSSLFDVQKNRVQVCSMSNFVDLVKALLGLMFDVRSF